MILRAEFALFGAGVVLSLVALLTAPRRAGRAWRVPTAIFLALAGVVGTLVIYQFLDPSRAAGRALWEWSAAGGPTIRASYRLDALGAIGIACGLAYTCAGLLASERSTGPRALPAVVLAIGFAFVAAAVANDLVAAIVALAVLAAASAFATLLVAPAQAAVRLAAYLAVGLQGFVVAALLVARQGGPSLVLVEIAPSAVTPGAILAATLGAALFAGLYPFVPWRYRALPTAGEREPLRGLLAMPAGIAGSLVLLRIIAAAGVDPTSIPLPEAPLAPRVVLALALLATFAVGLRLRGRPTPGGIGLTALGLALLLAYSELRWSHVVLTAALLTVLYAAAVSLALPEEWEVARHDVTLATLWIAFACGTPLALGAGLLLLVASAFAAIGESIFMPPHRRYIVTVIAATWTVTAAIALVIGAAASADLVTAVFGVIVSVLVLSLELAQAGRRLVLGDAPPDLEIAAAVAALIGTALLGAILAVPVARALDEAGRHPEGLDAGIALGVAIASTIAVVVARRVRRLVPDLSPIAAGLRTVVVSADPVPAGLAAFRILERAVTLSSAGFAFFERHAGVGLAAVLIVVLLVWSMRP